MMHNNMTYKSMTVVINNNVAHITLNRPDDFNTMNGDF
jgi:enoyl-CoA hydratase/carnithine racemase